MDGFAELLLELSLFVGFFDAASIAINTSADTTDILIRISQN